MDYKKDDINLLFNLLDRNIISLQVAVEWCYAQYTDEGAPEWIEKLTLVSDKQEYLEILRDKFGVSGELSFEYQIGEVAYNYKAGKMSLKDSINELLYNIYIDSSDSNAEKKELYIAEDFYDWHETPDMKAKEIVIPILNKYQSNYVESRNLFCE